MTDLGLCEAEVKGLRGHNWCFERVCSLGSPQAFCSSDFIAFAIEGDIFHSPTYPLCI